MTTLDRDETQKLFDAINTRMAFMPMGLNSSSDILWHFRLSNPLANKEFRDKDKNLWKIKPWDIMVSIEAGINKAGVGDGKEPTHAMTYSINYSIYGVVRNYRCKNWYESKYVHKYMYSRNIEDVVSKFIAHLQINVPGYIDHKFIINYSMVDITPENFIEYLQNPGQISKCYSAFHNYSTLNQWLAASQCVKIGPLNTFKGWEKLGRHVKKGERAIELIMPVITKEKDPEGDDRIKSIFFMPRRNWFTVHQTEGDEYIPEIPGFDFTHIDEELQLEKVEFNHTDGNCQGYASGNKYAINPVAANPMKTMFHEMAHILLGHTDQQMDDNATLARNIKEFQAESVALICAACIGQTDELKYSLGYIQNWGIPEELDKKMIEKLFSVSNKIISACKA